MRAILALALAGACNSDPKPPAPQTTQPPASAEVLPPGPRSPKVKRPAKLGAPLEWNTAPPELEANVTGFVTKDPNARELQRCKNTAWSYSGCWVVYPAQGRVWTKFECEHVVDDDMRNLVCHNYASHLAVGDGGPPDRKRGLDILQIGCDAGIRGDCAGIAEIVLWDEPDRVATYIAKACEEDPRNSPMGLCEDIKAAKTKLHRYAVTVTDVHGIDGITTATKCSLGVIDRGGSCRLHVACGERVLYGALGGEAPCKIGPDGPVGGEAMTSPEDDDPAVELGGKTLRLHDAASATAPEIELRGTLAPS
jgi:hypothetical protein